MKNLLKDIFKQVFKRLKQPTSATSLAVLISYLGISNSLELSNAISTFLVSGFSIYAIIKNDGSDKW